MPPKPCYSTFVPGTLNTPPTTMKTIKVQIIGAVSIKSAIESGIDVTQYPLTFHAYSNTMKARVLELYLKNPERIVLSFTNEIARDGEWHEPLIAM